MYLRNVYFGVFVLTLAVSLPPAMAAPLDNRFTYQGQLKQGGAPVEGPTDFEFSLWNQAALGAQIGLTQTKLNVSVDNGLFTVELDFGANAFQGDERWLQVAVRNPPGVGVYVPLTQRQRLTASPYSLFSLNTFWRAVGNAITNSNSGFVGINRSTTVSGAEYFGIQAPAAGTEYGGMYIRTDSATAKPFYGYRTGTQSAWTNLDGSTNRWHVYNDGIRLTVDDGGNVGIGEDDPTSKLHVSAATAGNALFVTNTGTGMAAQLYVPNGSSALPLYAVTYGSDRAAAFEAHGANSTHAVTMFKNGDPVLRLIGGFGGGTAATDAPLAIIGTSDSEPGGGGLIVAGSVVGANISIDANEIMARNNGATSPLYLNNDGGNIHMAVVSGGVSIGTTTIPTGVLLAVDGKVLCEEMEVQLSGDWPDYVFDDSYALMPLSQLEQAVEEHGHLPGIPSAADVAKDGVNVGKMQAQLLEKVEELTLYMIQMNKQMERVENENSELKARLAALEGGR